MPYRHTPRVQTYPPLAERKRRAAAKREREAAQMRSEAEELDRQWAAHVAEREAAKREAAT